MRVAYIRSSSVDQNHEYQIKAMEQYNIEKFFIDKASGKDTNRPEYINMMNFVRAGDEIYIYDLSRISRDLKQMLDIIDELNANDIKLVSIKENIDSSTSTGKLMLSMIGAVNEFLRTNQKEKQMEGIAIAKEKGKYKGRKKIEYPRNWQSVINQWRKREITAVKAMELTGLKRATFYRLLKEYTEDN